MTDKPEENPVNLLFPARTAAVSTVEFTEYLTHVGQMLSCTHFYFSLANTLPVAQYPTEGESGSTGMTAPHLTLHLTHWIHFRYTYKIEALFRKDVRIF